MVLSSKKEETCHPECHLFVYTLSIILNMTGNCSFLNLQVTITLKKEDTDPEKNLYNEYFYAGGLIEYVKWLNADKVCLMFAFFSISGFWFTLCFYIVFSMIVNNLHNLGLK